MQPIRVGNRLADRYLTKERVDVGRACSDYRALDMATGDAPVAVKLSVTLHPDPVKREFFTGEAVALKQRTFLKGMLVEGPKEKEYNGPSLVRALEDR